MWYRIQDKCSKFVLGKSGQDTNRRCFKVSLDSLYKRTSKVRRNRNPPIPNNLSSYTLCLPPSNLSSCSDVPSEYSLMIVHNINTTPYLHNHATSPNVAAPHTTSSFSQIRPPPSQNLLTPFPSLSTSPPFHNTKSFHISDTIPRYHSYPSLATRAVRHTLP